MKQQSLSFLFQLTNFLHAKDVTYLEIKSSLVISQVPLEDIQFFSLAEFSGMNRGLGVHIIFIRSITIDS